MSRFLAAFSVALFAPFAFARDAGPNIVFILADDIGWGDVGFHGGTAPTPNLDQLADDGLELTQHFVAPVCSPTRAGLLTGRYWSRFGVTTPKNELALPMGTVTLQRALQSQGYQTCLTGKWHLGSKPQWGPNHFGFDHSYGSLAGGVTSWSHRYKVGPFSRTWHCNERLIDETGHVTDLIANEAVQWITQRRDDPFFLYVPFTAVHLPINESQTWLDRVPQSIETEIARQYAASIMHLDHAVGQIVRALDKNGHRQNTLIVFTSDNGGSTATNNTQPYPPDDSPPGKLTANNGSLRGQKGSVYEGGVRVPTIVSWPNRIGPNQQTTPVCIVDWMPTFCNLAGYQSEQDLNWDGVDLSEWLINGAELPERSIYLAGPRKRSVALRHGVWKLIVHSDGGQELFRIDRDPFEQHNLAAKQKDRVQDMLRRLKREQLADDTSVPEAR
ncbi:Arylsulfatase precursor [Stieleria bergensis]|uniref:Arylsulfatase n=1 Tax=Stieleria bergensis TaxID=2528025 RepID=A0A517SV55_9BACT|nr:Arylsulfatase precursor [Planctomycetes bacterium SV_7m_r]